MFLMKKTGMLLGILLLAGCVQAPKNIYEWGEYQPTVYQYYQQDKTGPQEQIQALQKVIEQARAKDKPVPPGLHAQMGLLYSKIGNIEEAFQQFEIEKKLFPESAQYMDFLLNKDKGVK
ncbi:DUF4810 domain-containing protein [Xenorhabdus budapestensis]|uniref:DUF4810 domain-containing protein n=1 Tax=Xenorhabdus budapestensis TaxID=290110 RepID=A0A2D0J105_XENBU|nr:DUF4810 domain-containing protein [Xenorhabdus budapestensis]PHM27937.1 hypothetical protein Xbud_01960 [Xenorhabdus budapestensis]QTL39361.1 DUF4810 domain-containing protein [Xenorhabdus budapestensis]